MDRKEQKRLIINAHRKAAYARSTGKLIPRPCVICGEKSVEGHHTDYLKPLEVIWLCHNHHSKEHQKSVEHSGEYYNLLAKHNNWLKECFPSLAV
jgi:hypothetical protein